MNIAFVGHPAHRWSKSADFFLDKLRTLGPVTCVYPDEISVVTDLKELLDSNYDSYVFWQFDFLAYAFVAAGKNVIVIPMVDGSASYGSNHWEALKASKVICFSSSLFQYLGRYDLQRFHIQYFPDAAQYSSPDDSRTTYWWHRGQPNEGLIQSVSNFLSSNSSRKIKLRLDEGYSRSENSQALRKLQEQNKIEFVYPSNREEHLEQIKNADSLIAPRPAEGIGHGFLEALALGRPVIATDFPTMNEYIQHLSNGILLGRITKIPESMDFIKMCREALLRVEIWRKKFQAETEQLLEFITEKSTSTKKNPESIIGLIAYSASIYRGMSFPGGSKLKLEQYIRMRKVLVRLNLVQSRNGEHG